LRNALFIVDNS